MLPQNHSIYRTALATGKGRLLSGGLKSNLNQGLRQMKRPKIGNWQAINNVVLELKSRDNYYSTIFHQHFIAINYTICSKPVALPGKLKARPVQHPATPALIPTNRTIR
jgi:hypothetical protein